MCYNLILYYNYLALVVIDPTKDQAGWNITSDLLDDSDIGGVSSIFLPSSIIDEALMGKNISGCGVRMIVSLWDVDTSLMDVDSSALSTEGNDLVHGMG